MKDNPREPEKPEDSTDSIRACREGICVVCGRDIVDVILEKENRTEPTSVDFIRASRDGLCPDHLMR
jgi:hypothetical protein